MSFLTMIPYGLSVCGSDAATRASHHSFSCACWSRQISFRDDIKLAVSKLVLDPGSGHRHTLGNVLKVSWIFLFGLTVVSACRLIGTFSPTF